MWSVVKSERRCATPRPCRRRGWAILAAAWLVLALPSPAGAGSLAVVPILIGPIQVLLAILPAMLVALGGALLALLKPSAIKALLKMLWRNKIAAVLTIAAIVGLAYLSQTVLIGKGQAAGRAIAGGDWTAFRGGPERRGWSGDGADPVAGGAVWSFTREIKTFYSSPALAGNRLYVCSADKGVFADRGAVYCLDADNGAIVWKYSPGNFRATYSSPAVSGKYVVVGEGLHVTRDARINCLDSRSGKLLWEVRTASHVESSPCIAEGKAFVGAGDDGLWCIALESSGGAAKVLWHLEGKEYPDCETSPIVQNGRVYFGMGEAGCAVACVKADSGEQVWKVPAPYPVFGSPVLAEGKLFVAMGNGNLIESAEIVRDKKIRKMRQEKLPEAEIAKEAKRLSPAGEVWCLDPGTGKKIWDVKLPQTVLGVIACADGRIYFGSQDGVFHCLTTDGQVVFRRGLHEPIVTSAAVGKDHVYFLTDSGRLYALDWKNRLVWQVTVGTVGPFLSSPAVGRGHVYVGTAQNGLVCLGRPAENQAPPIWAGYLGGPGQSGWADGSPLSAQGNFAWRWPKDLKEDDPVPAIRAPAAYADGALYVGAESPGKVGLAKIVVASPPQSATAPVTREARASREGFKEQWFFPASRVPRRSPAVGGGRVYFCDGQAGEDGRSLYCVDAAEGRELWKLPVDAAASGEFLLTRQGIYAFVRGEELSCVAIAGEQAGKMVWSVRTGPSVGAPAVSGDLVLAATSAGVLGVDVRNHGVRWSYPSSAGAALALTTGPVANDDMVVIGTRWGLEALSIVNGASLWKVACGQVTSPIVCDENQLACATAAGELVVIDWTGKELLRAQEACPDLPPMLCGQQLLYCKGPPGTTGSTAAADESIQRVELPSGKGGRWLKTDWLGPVTAGPILVDSNLYFATSLKGLVCARPRK